MPSTMRAAGYNSSVISPMDVKLQRSLERQLGRSDAGLAARQQSRRSMGVPPALSVLETTASPPSSAPSSRGSRFAEDIRQCFMDDCKPQAGTAQAVPAPMPPSGPLTPTRPLTADQLPMSLVSVQATTPPKRQRQPGAVLDVSRIKLSESDDEDGIETAMHMAAVDGKVKELERRLQTREASLEAATSQCNKLADQLKDSKQRLETAECSNWLLKEEVTSLKSAVVKSSQQAEKATREVQMERRRRDDALKEEHCVICLSEAPVHAVVPCGHLVFCDGCKQEQGYCPCCRQEICMLLRVYKP